MEKGFRLKRAKMIVVMSAAFMLAPFGNLASEIFLRGRGEAWWNPLEWGRLFFTELNGMDQSLLVAIFIAGVALLFPKKNCWFLAILVMVWVSLHNILFFATEEGTFWSLRLVPALFNVPIFIILYYFRFPYLDKRDHLGKGLQKRFKVNIPVKIDGREYVVSSLSEKGCYIEGFKDLDEGKQIMVEFPGDFYLNFRVVHKSEEGSGGRFDGLSRAHRQQIKEMMRKK